VSMLTGDLAPTGVVVEAVQSDGRIRITARDEIDIATVEQFDAALDAAAADATRHRCGLVIDLRQTSFFGACALSSIVRVCQVLQGPGRSVTVVVGTPLQRRIFTLTGVDTLVTLEERLDG
jgi:anti-anti-sigma factor